MDLFCKKCGMLNKSCICTNERSFSKNRSPRSKSNSKSSKSKSVSRVSKVKFNSKSSIVKSTHNNEDYSNELKMLRFLNKISNNDENIITAWVKQNKIVNRTGKEHTCFHCEKSLNKFVSLIYKDNNIICPECSQNFKIKKTYFKIENIQAEKSKEDLKFKNNRLKIEKKLSENETIKKELDVKIENSKKTLKNENNLISAKTIHNKVLSADGILKKRKEIFNKGYNNIVSKNNIKKPEYQTYEELYNSTFNNLDKIERIHDLDMKIEKIEKNMERLQYSNNNTEVKRLKQSNNEYSDKLNSYYLERSKLTKSSKPLENLRKSTSKYNENINNVLKIMNKKSEAKYNFRKKILPTANPWKETNYNRVLNKVKANFPFKQVRKKQLEIISEVCDAIDKGYKYIALEAGTGTGKSVIAATLSRIYYPSFILTMTKQLQEQYSKDFKKLGFTLVKGRNNFPCFEKSDSNVSCDLGECLITPNFKCKYKWHSPNLEENKGLLPYLKNYEWKDDIHCKYLDQKVKGLTSNVVITNYDYALFELNFVKQFEKRKLLILDESHNLENKLMSFIGLNLSKKQLKKEIGLNVSDEEIKYLKDEGFQSWIDFIKKIKEEYEKRAKSLLIDALDNKTNKKQIDVLIRGLNKEILNYKNTLNFIYKNPSDWIIDFDQNIISFKPLHIDKYAKEYLLNFGETSLFMSATILDYKKFANWLGIAANEIYPIRFTTTFSSKNRPIISKEAVNMAYTALKYNAPKTIPIINKILEKHKNDKGVIHSVSYDCRDFIMENIRNKRLMSHDSQDRLEILVKFEKSNEPLVLVSPSMNEGVDFIYDKCRFQIIYKVPFPNTNDKQIEYRSNRDKVWYHYKTVLNLVQTYGRGMRAEDDYCDTYIIDSRFKDYIKQEIPNYLLPDFVKDAIE